MRAFTWQRLLTGLLVLLLVTTGFLVTPTKSAYAETGGYPYHGYHGPGSDWTQSYWTDASGNAISPYGYVYRNCTDYVAWKLQKLGVPESKTSGLGNGGDWYASAEKKQVPTGDTPKVGAVAVVTGGWGHVAYVEAVHANGTITVSEYNWPINGGYDGDFHRRTGTPASMNFTKFVYFAAFMTNAPDSASPTFSPDTNGYWHGTPPDGMVVLNGDGGGHRYVAGGGSLFFYNGSTPGLNDEFIEQMRQRYGTTQPAWMHSDEIHVIEGSVEREARHRPNNNTFVIDKSNNVWYMMQYGFAWPLASQEEVVYLGGTGKQVVLPARSMEGFGAAPTEWPTQIPDTTGNVTVLKALDDPAFYEMQAEMMYWLDNHTVLDCLVRYKGGAVQQVPLSLIHRFVDDGRRTGNISHCGFPPDVALYGPGGWERWYMYGENPYTRYAYASEFAMRCRWGDNLQQVVVSREALNQATVAAEQLHCPDDSYVRNRQNGEVFRVLSGRLHYVPSYDTLRCLVGSTPGEPTPIDEIILSRVPRGAEASCRYEEG